MDTLIAITVIVGGPGYLLATVLVLTLRLWLGRRGEGWMQIVVNALLLFLVALTCLYGITVLNALLPAGEVRRAWTRNGLAIVLAALPYAIVFTLGPYLLWKRHAAGASVADKTEGT